MYKYVPSPCVDRIYGFLGASIQLLFLRFRRDDLGMVNGASEASPKASLEIRRRRTARLELSYVSTYYCI